MYLREGIPYYMGSSGLGEHLMFEHQLKEDEVAYLEDLWGKLSSFWVKEQIGRLKE